MCVRGLHTRARARARVRACVRACASVCACVCAIRWRACIRTHAYTPHTMRVSVYLPVQFTKLQANKVSVDPVQPIASSRQVLVASLVPDPQVVEHAAVTHGPHRPLPADGITYRR